MFGKWVPGAVVFDCDGLLVDTEPCWTVAESELFARGGFAGTFAVTLAADEVTHPKPAPELYLSACARLGVDPGRCLALEDSATGIAAATAAGLRTLGVPTLAGRDIGAEVTVASLADPTLVTRIESWSPPGAEQE